LPGIHPGNPGLTPPACIKPQKKVQKSQTTTKKCAFRELSLARHTIKLQKRRVGGGQVITNQALTH